MREDPRATRTRRALRDSLRSLLTASALDDVSVAMLCRDAGVHRTTFYGHAAGVHQFAIAEFTAELDRIATVEVHADAETPGQAAGRYLASLRELLAHLMGDRTVYRALLTSDSRGAFRSALEARLRARADDALAVFAAQDVVGSPRSRRDRTQAAAFIAGAIVGVIDVWTLSDDVDPVDAATRISDLMPRWWPVGG